MFRCVVSAVRAIRPLSIPYLNAARIINNDLKRFSTRPLFNTTPTYTTFTNGSLLSNKQVQVITSNIAPVPVRTIIKLSLKKGKRKSSRAVIKRFFRLDWGGWIRTKAGRQKRLWKKSSPQKRRLRQHVLCNATQSTLLDKMVTKYWKRPKYYVEDPYAPYHTREEFPNTRKKPLQRH